MSVTSPVLIEDITGLPEVIQRVLRFDPAEVYERIYKHKPQFDRHIFSHYKRRNHVNMSIIFPKPEEKICSCGCGAQLTGKRTRWATDDCQTFAFTVHQIITGETKIIRHLFRQVLGDERCLKCNRSDNDIKRVDYTPHNITDPLLREKAWNRCMREEANKIHVEHITPVHKGGGGCWLSNYQLLCEDCHKIKTKSEK